FVTAASLGGAVGFLFSVPRILAKDPVALPQDNGQVGDEASFKAQRARLLSSNSNLERISEWLTTMLVGVGLTQIGAIGEQLKSFSTFLATRSNGLGNEAGALVLIGPFLLMFGLVAGFIFFYLYTRIYLSPLFQHVELILDRVLRESDD